MKWFGKPEVVGLDIGHSCIKAVQLMPTTRGFYLKHLALEPLPPVAMAEGQIKNSELVANTIRKLFKTHKIGTKQVTIAVAGPAVCIKRISIPKVPLPEIPELVQWEAFQYLPFDTRQVYLDFQLLPSAPEAESISVLLVAAQKTYIDELIWVVNKAGLVPVIVDSEALALENQYEVNYHLESEKVVALVDIGASIINVSILRDGSTIFASSVLGGGNLYTQAIQAEFNLNYEEAEQIKRGRRLTEVNINKLRQIILEVSEKIAFRIKRLVNCFESAYPEENLSKILISGGGAQLKGLDRFLGRYIQLPVEMANPLKEIIFDEKKRGPQYFSQIAPLTAIGVGLALRRIGDA